MSAIDCPDRQKLRDYTVGRLAPELVETVAEHVERCPDCQATLLTLADVEDTLVAQLRRPLDADPYSEEAECRAVEASAEAMAAVARSAGRMVDDVRVAAVPLPRQLGEYQLLEKLGQGGMGTVYMARHTRLDRIVALKLLPQGSMSDPRLRARFEKEMKAVGRLDHANIVQAHDARDIEGTPVLVMEYVEGMDLGRVAALIGPLPIADACEAARQTAVGLQAAHEHGMVHRDVKPSNLMLARGGQVKILDLGLARLAPLSADDASTRQAADGVLPESLTSGFSTMGTADYMAPEQVTDAHLVDIRADTYGLGCTLYRLLAGRTPFSGLGYVKEAEKMIGHVRDVPRPLVEWRPDVPAGLAAVIERMMAKEPAARFATPAEVAEALKPFAAAADLPGLLTKAQGLLQRLPADSDVSRQHTDPFTSSALTGTQAGRRGLASAEHGAAETDRRDPPAGTKLLSAHGRRKWVVIALGLTALAAGLALGILVVIKDRTGKTLATLHAPEGSKLEVSTDDQAAQGGDKPPVSPGKSVAAESTPPDPLRNTPPEVVARTQVTTMELVLVGDPGNAVDPRNKLGSVDYPFYIGKFEVTAGQYTAFLNAVAVTDPFECYGADMGKLPLGCNIQRSGTPGHYKYSVTPEWANRPVNYISFWRAARFINWLQNGQPTGQENAATTESGAYSLNGFNGYDGTNVPVRNPGATWVIPSINEWYKAAYYKGGATNAGYWTYPTRSDRDPSAAAPRDLKRPNESANLLAVVGTSTDVGSYTGSAGPYGTFDQAGNVDEWTETLCWDGWPAFWRGYCGGSWGDFSGNQGQTALAATDFPHWNNPGYGMYANRGFRVAKVSSQAKEQRKDQNPDRRAAEWVLVNGGTVTVSASGAESSIKSIEGLPQEPFKVKAINLEGCKSVTDEGLANVEGISECHLIDLDNTNITDKGLEHLKGFAQLDELHLRWTPIRGHGLVHLQGSKGLKQMWLFGAGVDDEGIANLKFLPSLQFLELDANGKLTDKGVENVRFLKDLRTLVGGHGPYTDASLKAIAELSHLEKLWFYNTQITSQGVAYLSKLPALVHLGLARCPQLDDRVADALKGFRSLKAIELSDTAVTTAGAAKIHAVLPNCSVGGFDK